jgi:type I restriction enzyme S subunit
MSSRMYHRYKDSGVEWIGEVPDHWDLDRFKRSTISCRNGIWGSEPNGDENDIPCVRVADFDRGNLSVYKEIPTIRNVSKSERSDRTLSSGNLLLEKSGGGDLQPVGFVVLYNHDVPAVCSNFVAKMELAQGMVPSYWRYCHAAAYAVRLNHRSIKQTSGIQNLDQSQYLDERAPFPPEDEQKAISSFLDVETLKIDGLVSEQRRLIELLKEKRQAVISHAVTKGLNPNAPMKPSGIQWLGDVPQHWVVGPLKHFWSVTDCKHVTAEFVVDGGIPLASIREVQSKWINLDGAKQTTQEFFELLIEGDREPQVGDLIFSRNATVGEVAQVGEHTATFAMGQDVCLLRKYDNYSSSDYWQHVLKSTAVVEQIGVLMVGATFKRINVDEIRNLAVVSPPSDEQGAIAKFVEKRVGRFDMLQAEAERAIELLQERRTALISAAVTGKIDVRGFVKQEALA